MGLQDLGLPDDEGDTPAVPSGGNGKDSPQSPPGAHLTPRERKVWDYICGVLRDEGIPHKTAGIAITIICKTFVQYVRTELELRQFIEGNGGSILVKSQKSEYTQPHPLYYAARDIKQELLKWLPEACLSLPSAVMARAKLGDAGKQDDLFDDLVEHGRADRRSALTH
ncbi:P27 family phage terminase small subunit [Cupriavidus respiraculi]|uniref:P27 family phage terminase small subunit n=1 Tax=Cupriavidus respiraculi TaxID=195930 RepID=A0ABN7ZJ05_9BURK|nr:P27 family phage terminase small subunit [Cupriavidus respiraculi]CAG9184241.1 hypothetical protein LMG21510_05048 [Cupriavidus respiraculi]